MILIIGDPDDLHSRHIRNHVRALGEAATVVDFAAIANHARIVFDIGPGRRRSLLSVQEPLDLTDVRTVWLRRPAMVQPPAAVTSPAARRFVRHEWSAAVNGMAMAQDHLRWVNDPFAQNGASKPLQLYRARQAGLDIPDTLITNDPQQVRDFVREHEGNVIHKTLTHAEDRLLETRPWDEVRDGVHLDDALPIAPVTFQSSIRGGDVRCVVVGETVLSVFVDSDTSRSAVDSRLDLDAKCSVHELPNETAGKLLDLMSALGLVFGIVDFKLDRDGRYVFLEVNPQGQFMFMEILTRLPISETLARFLLSGVSLRPEGAGR